MHPAKTDLARTALAVRDSTLKLADRRLLILCDGKRTIDELTALLGPNTPGTLERLHEQGFLSLPPPVAPQPPPQQQPPATTRNRRSAAVAKIYMTDMLGRMRRDDADTLSSHLHATRSEPEVMAAVDAALRFIAEISGPSYARRTAIRLAEVVPEDWLAAPDSILVELSSDSAESL